LIRNHCSILITWLAEEKVILIFLIIVADENSGIKKFVLHMEKKGLRVRKRV
jgi:hypothetical protein